MEKIKRKETLFIRTLLLSLLLCLAMFMPVSVMSASADEAGEDAPHSVEAIIENTTFIAFRKSDIPSYYKRSMFACYYVPNEYYESSYIYGVIIFPKDYADRFGIKSDYLKTAEEKGVKLAVLEAPGALEGANGKIFKCGLVEILEQNVTRTFSFIFYVKDSEGNIEYTSPKFAEYNTLDAKDFSDSELIEMAERKLETENSFKAIVDKLVELIDSIWTYVVLGMVGVVVVWGGFIGIRIIVANRNEEKINARNMLKSLVIGIIVMFTIAVVCPMLIKGLSAWITW